MNDLIQCGTCGYPLTPEERTGLVEVDGVMVKPEQQKPVAWMHTKIEGVAVFHRPADLDKHPDRWEALYKAPPPCPTCEALARTVMLDQTSHDTHCKPLTDEQVKEAMMDAKLHYCGEDDLLLVRAVEAAHGIKG